MYSGTVRQPFRDVDIVLDFYDTNGNSIRELQVIVHDIGSQYILEAPLLDNYKIVGQKEIIGVATTESIHSLTYEMISDDSGDEKEEGNIPNKNEDENGGRTGC